MTDAEMKERILRVVHPDERPSHHEIARRIDAAPDKVFRLCEELSAEERLAEGF